MSINEKVLSDGLRQMQEAITTLQGAVVTDPVEPPKTGYEMPGDLRGWKQIFADDFKDPAAYGDFLKVYGDRWGAYPANYLTTYAQNKKTKDHYDPNNIAVADSKMLIKAEVKDDVFIGAAPTPKFPGQKHAGRLYGRYAIRLRVVLADGETGDGIHVVPLLWPVSERWPQDGEINWPEGDADGTASAFMHYQDATSADIKAGRKFQDEHKTAASFTDWHTYVIEWTPEVCRFICDYETIGESKTRIPNTPMRPVIQIENSKKVKKGLTVEIDWYCIWEPAA